MPEGHRFRRWYATFVAATLVALAGLLVAIAVGGSRQRLGPIAGFLAMTTVSVGYERLARRELRRRRYHQGQSPVPRGVRLTKPLWMRLDQCATVVGIAGAVSAVVAIGFPQVASGIFLVLGILSGVPAFADFGVSDITFEQTGMRVHRRSAHCLIPWSSIRVVDPVGPPGYQMLRLVLADLDRIRESVSPSTARKDVESIFGSSGDELVLMPWTAGLDGQALERAIREGIAGVPDRLN